MTTESPAQAALLRPLTPADAPRMAEINRAAEPGVSAADAEELAEILRVSEVALAAETDGALAGFVMALTPGRPYASANYRWFEARGGDFLYVDRIAIAPEARGLGLGTRLHAALFAAAGARPIALEVNTLPPNPGSMRFHQRLGFLEVGRAAHRPGAYEVAFLERPAQRPDAT